MQSTSLQAYYDKVLPNLNRRQEQVLDVFYSYPDRDFTNMELAQSLNWSVNRVTPRTYELREQGVLRWSRIRRCMVTGNKAKTMEVS